LPSTLPLTLQRRRVIRVALARRTSGVDDAHLRFYGAAEGGGARCRAHLASAEGVLAMMPLASDDDWLLSLPLFHVSGQGILWRWLLAGARLTVRESSRWNRRCRLYACLAGADSALAPAQ
jgi:acyl-CoA synthetase (AMP-forming)/AMP-acid ligase II